jgi:hypothetical protein
MDKTFFSGSSPNLLNEKALKNLNIFLEENTIEVKSTGEHIITLYKEYIRPNIFALFILLVVCSFLFVRYLIKKHNIINLDTCESQNSTRVVEKNNNDLLDSDNITLSSGSENKKNKKKTSDTMTDDFDDNKSRFTELNEEYNKAVKENVGNISEQALKDIYKKKKDKFTFDELTRIIVEGS